MIDHRSDLEPIKVCPRCGNETSEEILNEISGCYFCGNTDFSEEAELLRDYEYRKVNCSSCGKLMTTNQGHWYNPLFYKFPKRVRVNLLEGVRLCNECDSKINVKQDFTRIKKIIKLHNKGKR